MSKMKVDVWSDIMCPFCYIGKRNYEAALEQFAHQNHVEIEWHSFQLDPTIPKKREVKENIYQYLADRKGIPYEQSKQLHQSVVEMAQKVGLSYNFEKAVIANSFDAHRLIQLAKTKGLGDAIEEQLFKGYFTDGVDFSNHQELMRIGKEIGLSEHEIVEVLESDKFSDEVLEDIHTAQSIGVRGVPFFVFNNKYAVSGAQPPAVFLDTLQKSFGEWQEDKPFIDLERTEGPTCTPDGICE